MPTPIKGYFLKSGKKVPGTTTVIGRFKDSGPLMYWAFKQGKDGAPSLYAKRDEAGDIGTAVHEAVDADIKGLTRPLLPHGMDADKVASGFNAWLRWKEQTKLKIIETEMQLVSEIYGYGGTPDGIGLIGNELCLIDFKTSNAVYRDYLYQLAAYNQLWIENHPDRPLTGGFHILRFAKEHGDFAHHHYPNLDEAWEGFKLMLGLYEIDLQLKRRAA